MNRPGAKKLAVLAVAAAVLAAPAAAQTTTAFAGGSHDSGACAQRVLPSPQRAQAVAKHDRTSFGRAAAANDRSQASFEQTALSDATLWLDTCGKAYFVEPASTAQAAANAPSAESGPVVAQDAFSLESKPGAERTLYLDFTGDQVTGTGWNQSYGSTIDATPYSIDSDPATFSDAERAEVQKAWQVVAEDYAPFDVNVTTRDLGAAVIDRTSTADTRYGTRVIISADPSGMQSRCGCGGVGYLKVFSDANRHSYYQPAWVFTKGVGTGGKGIGEAAAHEAGHNFGLNHDGTSTSGYYSGAGAWAPIMGVGYHAPVSQWSKGDYPDANNRTDDDTTVIAASAPLMTDDYGSTTNPAALANGQTRNGLVTTRDDVDAFTFTAQGATTVTLTPGPFADLDGQLTIRDALGVVLATVDPRSAKVSAEQASGMGASWTATLPSTSATYTASVDGVGTGDPATAGLYSDYGSLGSYQISLSTNGTTPPPPAGDPLTLSGANPAAATVGQPWSATPVTAQGGTSPYAWSATGLPAGLSVSATSGVITGTPTAAGTYAVTVLVKDARGTTASKALSLLVNPAPVAAVKVANQSLSRQVGVAQSSHLVASGGNGSYTWAVSSGTLPAGLTLSTTGVLSGTPSTAGPVTFSATATSGGASATGTITVTTAPASSTPPTGGGTWTWTWTWSGSGGSGTTSGTGTPPWTFRWF